ncbi:hypothetical protein BGW38_002668 [Lunasporangiospora selenospora]|uniref:Major facilitator superfamily (MFS) profile domain-containing protein n=1 Tax=Lunasporangiospora selenospora TaxID=979761 RepID=A0A9P6KDD1_9FUNG|nr:hypothetical protein BGW38_002668 [Lunasporangiospora selenospora]
MATDPPSNTDKLSVSSVVAVDQTSDTLKEVMYPTHTQHWQQMSKESKLGSDEEQYPQYMEDDVEELDPMAVKKLRRKLDFHLVPLVSILYLCSFLDRVNIGTSPL